MVQARSEDQDETASTSALPLHQRAARLIQAHQKKHATVMFHDRRGEERR